MTDTPDTDTYALKSATVAEVAAPDLPYGPPMPKAWRPRIALVGAGGIAAAHLEAYRDAGFDVAVIASRTLKSAVARRDAFFPAAEATDDVERTLARDDIEVVDLTPHPDQRLPLIETALKAGKHVLSQKPFVLDLDAGQRLVDLAGEKGRVLAVNQNGRFAPHLSWMREAVRAGLVGDLQSVHVSIHWDHNWIGGTVFEDLHELILYDFAIHWFDFLTSLIGSRATSVYATTARGAGQRVRPPLLAQASVEFDGGQAALLAQFQTYRYAPFVKAGAVFRSRSAAPVYRRANIVGKVVQDRMIRQSPEAHEGDQVTEELPFRRMSIAIRSNQI
ncbi:MAG: Gfo/Idh/MocA family oxidoreductase [Rhizobiales bacterium]|nr:Gfo/Idh/MocA family oxidoreductase [Hyphomicrobiales bacterium]